jgi:hypothetical protein
MHTNSQEPAPGPDARAAELIQIPIDLARAEAALMIDRGMGTDMAFRRLEAGYQKSYETRTRIEAAANAQQPTAPAPTTPQAPPPAMTEQPAPPTLARPPIEEPRTLGEKFMVNAPLQREQHLEQERTVDARMHMSMPMGLKPRR